MTAEDVVSPEDEAAIFALVQEGEGQHNPWRFSDRAIYELVRDHPGEIDPRRADWLWLVGILVSRGR